MSTTLQETFQKYYQHNPKEDMENFIEYFCIFGGLHHALSKEKTQESLVEEIFLKNFKKMNASMQKLVEKNTHYEELLYRFAIGDRRVFKAFTKAGFNNANGGSALEFFTQNAILSIEYSREVHPKKYQKKVKRHLAKHRISHKVLFCLPYVRFWYYFVFPFKEEIDKGNYEAFFKNFLIKKNTYVSFIFERLSALVLKEYIQANSIISSGSFWNRDVEIDLLVLCENRDIYVGECKWSNHKINKKEYHKLLAKCEHLQIKKQKLVFFSKRGFSKEFIASKSSTLLLFNCEDFKTLLALQL